MGQITIENLHGKAIDYNANSKRLLDVLLEHTDWMHACGGKGRCTTCKAVIIEKNKDLPALTESEQRFINSGKLADGERLSCQVILVEDIDMTIRVDHRNKLPHLNYSS